MTRVINRSDSSSTSHTTSHMTTIDTHPVIELTDRESFDKFISTNKLVVVDFWAHWCGPCCRFAPTYASLATENVDVAFAKVECDDLYEITQHFGISSLPTFIAFINGKEYSRVHGANEKAVRAMINELILAQANADATTQVNDVDTITTVN